jgi:hypothetical protein
MNSIPVRPPPARAVPRKEASMNTRAICEGQFTLPISVENAMSLFTPEGERRWAGPSWDPVYPIPGAASDDSAPGTVFTTERRGDMDRARTPERRHELRPRGARPHRGNDHCQMLAGSVP